MRQRFHQFLLQHCRQSLPQHFQPCNRHRLLERLSRFLKAQSRKLLWRLIQFQAHRRLLRPRHSAVPSPLSNLKFRAPRFDRGVSFPYCFRDNRVAREPSHCDTPNMSDAFNTAKAYLDAGNLVSARRLIEEALENDPHSVEASVLLVSLVDKETGPKDVLDLTARFITQWPDVIQFRMSRLSALAELEKVDEMRNELARLRSQFPFFPQAYHFWCGVFEVRFGSTAHAAHHLDDIRRRGDPSGFAPVLESMIAVCNADFISNERFVRERLSNGYADAETIADLSLCEFFNLKIGDARRTALQALSQDPREATAKAVMVLSRLVWFPPFFFAHLCMLPSGSDSSEHSPLMRLFLGAIDFWLIIILMLVVGMLAIWPSIWTALCIVLLFAGWWFWLPIMNRVLKYYGRRAKAVTHVDLKDF